MIMTAIQTFFIALTYLIRGHYPDTDHLTFQINKSTVYKIHDCDIISLYFVSATDIYIWSYECMFKTHKFAFKEWTGRCNYQMNVTLDYTFMAYNFWHDEKYEQVYVKFKSSWYIKEGNLRINSIVVW